MNYKLKKKYKYLFNVYVNYFECFIETFYTIYSRFNTDIQLTILCHTKYVRPLVVDFLFVQLHLESLEILFINVTITTDCRSIVQC